MTKILLNKRKDKKNVNLEGRLVLNIKNSNKLLPIEDIVKKVNAHEVYLSEKKASQTYRLSFEINPFCSNVLFNNISEIIYKEGSDDCIVFTKNGFEGNTKANINDIKKYCRYKNINVDELNRNELIRDTSFSHPLIGGVVYHCGYDIFNNHTLRKKEFNVINKLTAKSSNKQVFNTIFDYHRDKDGKNVEDYTLALKDGRKKINKHLYQIDNIYSFEESINENLIEKNGWLGFINPNGLNIDNYVNEGVSISLNKCMNNNKGCEMYDMYPDRSLFSFIPKINKYRNNRVEKNWDYCLTYPYENYYNDVVQYEAEDGTKINGIECVIVNDIFNGSDEYIDYEDYDTVTLKTKIKNSFGVNTILNIVLIGDINGREVYLNLDNNVIVNNVGINEKDRDYYFTINGSELMEMLNKFNYPSKVQIRVRKVNNGGICSYYFRRFKRIPNFKNTDVFNDNIVDNEEINKYCNVNFNSTINGLAFSRNIYNDRNAQILFNDNIELKGLRDNLGRELSEIYLTIVKNNKGNEKWYDEKDYTSSEITFSHCFGEITSGIDIKDSDIFDYNIHKIHNVKKEFFEDKDYWDSPEYSKALEDYMRIYKKDEKNGKVVYNLPRPLEHNITINGVEESGVFLGDIVEFNRNTLNERILEVVYHRFNTRQREIIDSDFSDLEYDEIISDDYDLTSSFSAVTRNYSILYNHLKLPINISPEGYYYKPHHRIVLKEYKDKINQGEHTLVNIATYNGSKNNIHEVTLSKNYFMESMEKLYLYHKVNNNMVIGYVNSVEGIYRTFITIKAVLNEGETLSDYIIYKHNVLKPDTAYELKDGSGIYLWKDFKDDYEYDINSEIRKYTFTNNAHYINQNINFYLHRQDPDGFYKLNNSISNLPLISNLTVEGDTNDYSGVEMINDIEEVLQC